LLFSEHFEVYEGLCFEIASTDILTDRARSIIITWVKNKYSEKGTFTLMVRRYLKGDWGEDRHPFHIWLSSQVSMVARINNKWDFQSYHLPFHRYQLQVASKITSILVKETQSVKFESTNYRN
jgi:hypothetical protein